MSGAWCPCWDESVGSWGPSHLPAEVSAHRDGWGRGGALVSWNHFLDTQQWQCIVSSPPDVSLSEQRASRNLGEDTNPRAALMKPPEHNAEQRTVTFMWCLGGDAWALGAYTCSHIPPHKVLCGEEPFLFLLTHVLSTTRCLHVNHTSSMLAELTVAWMRHRDK